MGSKMFNKKTWILRVVMMAISLTIVLYAHYVLKTQPPGPESTVNLLLDPASAQKPGIKATIVTTEEQKSQPEPAQK